MSRNFAAEFENENDLVLAASRLQDEGYVLLDAFSPVWVEQLDELLSLRASLIRPVMLAVGLTMAALAFGVQWYSSVISYPLNLGGRPLNSWPVFLLVPFEVGVLAAVVAGLIVFLFRCGLPALHDPAFEIVGFERASQDRFFLLVEGRAGQRAEQALRDALRDTAALRVLEVWPR